jgi:hypothetical protein
MSFYINLSSTHSRDVHPQNHGGDFQVVLPAPMYFNEEEPWEVALAEMTYDVQGFPNIPSEFSHVQMEVVNNGTVFDCTQMDLSITAYLQTKRHIWHLSDSDKIVPSDRVAKYVIPKKNFTWKGFKKAVKAMGNIKKNTFFSYDVSLTDTQLEIKFNSKAIAAKFEFSPDLIKFLSLEKNCIEAPFQWHYIVNRILHVNYGKPSIKTKFIDVFPPNNIHPIWIEILAQGRYQMQIPIINTLDQIAATIQKVMKDEVDDNRCKWSFNIKETNDDYQWEMTLEALEAIDISLHFSHGFLHYLGVTPYDKWSHFSSPSAAPPFIIKKGIIVKVKAANPIYNTNFAYNYYPSTEAFCDGLNSAIMKLALEYIDVDEKHKFFTLEKIEDDAINRGNTGKVIFNPFPFLNITLDPFVLNLLHLESSTIQNTSKSIVVLPSVTREFFHLYTNIISSHTYCGAKNVLRVINNIASTQNDKIMMSFPHLYYHPISQFFIPNIEIRITDNHSDLILPFQKEVTCLLHFRRCINHLV